MSDTVPPGVLLHVGCGRALLPEGLADRHWREIRYDIDPSVEPDLIGSMTDMAQIADASVDAIWSSHNLEHLAAHELRQALAEFVRVLRPGGVAWMVVPDVQSLAERIAAGDLDGELYRSPAGPIAVVDVLWGHRPSLAAGRHWMAHRTGFSAATLERRLVEAGFRPVRIERRPQAFELFATAVRSPPVPTPDELFEQGRRRHAAGAWSEAEGLYRQVLEIRPGEWRACYELGIVCHLQGRKDEAISHLRQVVASEPCFARGQLALGTFLAMGGEPQAALAHLQRAVQLEPNSSEARYNLGNCWSQLRKLTQAEDEYRAAIRLDPENGLACVNLGKLYNERWQVQQGLALYRAGLQHLSDPALHSNLPMLMNFADSVPDPEVFAAHRAFDQRFVAPLAGALEPLASRPPADKRLRVAYLSRDLRRHSVRYFLLPILAHHDHEAFEIACYFDGERADDVTDLFRLHADHWIECHGWSDAELAERLRHDQTDILIDLGGHTDRNRLLVFARRPAPVQISYLGYPSTTGVSTIDYRISDRWLDPEPPATQIPSSEVPLRLPHGYFCYAPIAESPAVSALPFDHLGYITFGSLSQGAKLNSALFACWAEILRSIPDSRLWVQNSALGEEHPRQTLISEFQRLGVDHQRLSFHPFGPAPAYLQSYHQIDIALDSFPYNGGTTTCEALWMGVPVVSWSGQRHVARLGASILGQIGLGELVAHSPQSYVETATALARDVDRLRSLRSTMRHRLATSPLMDHPGFTRELETAYRAVWRRWCASDLAVANR